MIVLLLVLLVVVGSETLVVVGAVHGCHVLAGTGLGAVTGGGVLVVVVVQGGVVVGLEISGVYYGLDLFFQ